MVDNKVNNESYNMLNKNEKLLFYKYAVPNILSLVLLSSAGIVDAAFIGTLVGETELAAVNIVNPLFSFMWGLSMMIMIGGAVNAGKYIGENNITAARQIFTKSITAVTVSTLIITAVVYIFNEEIIYLIGRSTKTLHISSEYLTTILPFIIFTTAGYGLTVFARVDGFPFIASASLIAGAISNIILDAIFIAVMDMGVKGAALATGISYIITFVIIITHYMRKKGVLRLTFKLNNWNELIKTSSNGVSEFLNEISVGIVMMLFNLTMMKYAKESGVAAFTAINYIMWVGNMINYGAADTLNPLISVNYGAGQYNRIKNLLKTGITFTIINGVIVFLILTIFDRNLTMMFIKNVENESFIMSIEFMSFIKWAFFINGINMVLSSYFTAMLRPKESATIAILRSLILPSVMIYILPLMFNKYGIYSAIPLSEILTFAVAVFLYFATKNVLLKR